MSFETVENLGYKRGPSGYPLLRLALDGDVAEILLEQKQKLLDAGIVFLGSDWRERVPVINFSPPGVTPTELRGFTQDERVLAAYKQFLIDADTGKLSS